MDVRNIIRIGVSTHSRLKAAAVDGVRKRFSREVSTHSRLKAAAAQFVLQVAKHASFNTQPPEGGW